jgi:hypothetical protein
MSLYEVSLNPLTKGPRRAFLRELSGREEALFTAPSSVLASELVGRLLVSDFGGAASDVWALSVSDRDRLIAELYSSCYGDRIDAVTPCSGCGKGFELGFSLRELLGARSPAQPAHVAGPDATGVYSLPGLCRFRLPTAGDEREAAGLPPSDAARALLERCVVEGSSEGALEPLEAALEALAPVLQVELPMRCPHCELEQTVSFDVVRFFAQSLLRERPILLREVHCLAGAYHWSRAEILALPRSERRAYVALVLAERRRAPEGYLS